MSTSDISVFTTQEKLPVTYFNGNSDLLDKIKKIIEKHDLRFAHAVTEETEKGMISAAVFIAPDKSLQLWNYHPMRNTFTHVYDLNIKDVISVKSNLEQSLASLKRLIDTL